MKIILAIAIILLSTGVARAEICMPMEVLALMLAMNGEVPLMQDDEKGYSLTRSPETGAWSLVRVKKNGEACLVRGGHRMEFVK